MGRRAERWGKREGNRFFSGNLINVGAFAERKENHIKVINIIFLNVHVNICALKMNLLEKN